MEYIINNADICELAHLYTSEECNEKGIYMYQDDTEENYSDKAQDIFNRHHDIISEIMTQ